jgi:hypothetical protein
MNVDKISFTSKINFVDAKTFYNVCVGRYIDFSDAKTSIVKADEFYTEAVRTCSAGGLHRSATEENLGYHIYDGIKRSTPIEYFVNDMFSRIKNPDRALLLGGKRLRFNATESMKRFHELKNTLFERVKNVTYFEEHAIPDSESNLCYINHDDTWYINTVFKDYKTGKDMCVDTLEKLLKAFKHISIAKGDTLYINDNQVKLSNDLYQR